MKYSLVIFSCLVSTAMSLLMIEGCDNRREGEVWQRDHCTKCYCRNNLTECDQIFCSAVICPNNAQPRPIPGTCCGFTCENEDEIRCPAGYQHLGAYCYKYFPDKLNFTEAKSTCNKAGSILSEPRNYEQSEIFFDFVEKQLSVGEAWIWFGLEREKNGKGFIWSSNEQPLSFSNWHPRQPNNWRGKQGCGELIVRKKAIFGALQTWNDDECEHERSFVCQREPSLECKDNKLYDCATVIQKYGMKACKGKSMELHCKHSCKLCDPDSEYYRQRIEG